LKVSKRNITRSSYIEEEDYSSSSDNDELQIKKRGDDYNEYWQ
jgi:hypothetical protein